MRLRTQISSVQEKASGKWSVSFATYKGIPGDEHLVSEIESGAVFDCENHAYAGGNRALDVLEETSAFPNMCEPF